MTELLCKNPECTVSQTGICILSKPVDECPNRIGSANFLGDIREFLDEPLLASPEDHPRFPGSTALSLDEARSVRSKGIARVIGILGTPNSGKTACLVSLYLLLASGKLDGFSFADSKSLMAFDDLSRGAREWTNGAPEQMTAHTELKEGRTAGFLHLKIVRDSDGARLNLLVPDLPGEWSTTLVDSNRTDRLKFLRSADAIWVMVDGRTLTDRAQRRNAIHRTCLLIDRVTTLCKPELPVLRLVVTWSDLGQPSQATLDEINEYARARGVTMSFNSIASFSLEVATAPGAGIAELVSQTVENPKAKGDFWPEFPISADGSRSALRIQSERPT